MFLELLQQKSVNGGVGNEWNNKPIFLLLQSGCRTVSNNGSGSGLAPAQNILAV